MVSKNSGGPGCPARIRPHLHLDPEKEAERGEERLQDPRYVRYVIESEDQLYLNTGVMYAPSRWLATSWSPLPSKGADVPPRPEIVSVFDAARFDPITADDDLR